MGLFSRKKNESSRTASGDGETTIPSEPAANPRSVGVVSGVLSSPVEGTEETTLFGDVVARRFGPSASGDPARSTDAESKAPPSTSNTSIAQADSQPAQQTPLGGAHSSRAVPPKASRAETGASAEPLFSDNPALPALEVDPMAHIGRSTTITGDIVAEEDLEIQGTVEGSVRLTDHQVTIGNEGHVKASVEANIVSVYGRITGNVIAAELVEIDKGGIVGGDIKAPRIIMHDGAVVVGGLDMSVSLPNVPDAKNKSVNDASASRSKTAPKASTVAARSVAVADDTPSSRTGSAD